LLALTRLNLVARIECLIDAVSQVGNIRLFDQFPERPRIDGLGEIKVGTEFPKHAEHDGHLLLGKKIDLQIQMSTFVRLAHLPPLIREHKQREDDGLEADDRGEQTERKGIELKKRLALFKVIQTPKNKACTNAERLLPTTSMMRSPTRSAKDRFNRAVCSNLATARMF
jgi:hypothetical protein